MKQTLLRSLALTGLMTLEAVCIASGRHFRFGSARRFVQNARR